MANKKTKQPVLTSQDIRELKSKLHHLKPSVIIGTNGLINAVIQEIDQALNDHELIKIRVHLQEHQEKLMELVSEICSKTNSTLIQVIGHIIAIYRKNLQSEEGLVL